MPEKNVGKIGIISPSGIGLFQYPNRVKNGQKFLDSKGIDITFAINAFHNEEYHKDTARGRMEDLYQLLRDPEIDTIMASIGGYAAIKILPSLNYEDIAQYRKKIIGYGDVTALLLAIYVKTGMEVYHGPMFLSEICEYESPYDYTWENFCRALSGERINYFQPLYEVKGVTDWIGEEQHMEIKEKRFNANGWQIFSYGFGRAPILGGNMETILGILDTQYLPIKQFENKILFLEDRTKETGRFEAMLYALKIRGIFSIIEGLIIGKSETDCVNDNMSIVLEKVLGHDSYIPVIYHVDLGHTNPMITIPIGRTCVLEVGENISFYMEEKVKSVNSKS